MRDVAAKARVSTAAASIALRGAAGVSEETRSHILSVAKSMGYRRNRAASLMKLTRTNLIGLTFDPSNPYHADLAGRINEYVLKRDHELVPTLVTDGADPMRAAEFLLGLKCEGIILLSPQLGADELADLASRTALVLVGHHRQEPHVDIVHSSDHTGVQQVVSHLIGLGHTRITHVDGGSGSVAKQRRAGYLDAMTKAGLEKHVDVLPGGQGASAGRRAVRRLLSREHRPTAICAFNDAVALAIYDELTLEGLRVPDDVSLTGYDNTPISNLNFVNLTSVDQRLEPLTRAAVDAVTSRMAARATEKDLPPRTTVLEPSLMPRRTSGPLPQPQPKHP